MFLNVFFSFARTIWKAKASLWSQENRSAKATQEAEDKRTCPVCIILHVYLFISTITPFSSQANQSI